MKVSRALLISSLFIVFLVFPLAGCRAKDKVVERKVVQIGGQSQQALLFHVSAQKATGVASRTVRMMQNVRIAG